MSPSSLPAIPLSPGPQTPNAAIAHAVRKVRSQSHPCAGCGTPVSGSRPACLECVVDAFVKQQKAEHPDSPVERAAIAAFVLDNPDVNRF